MIVKYLTFDKRVTLESDCADLRDAFEFLADATEIFSHERCGACQGQHLRPEVRHHDSFKFYTLKCMDCGAGLNFGQRREDGGLFPKRKDAAGNWLENGGWTVYQKQDGGF